MSPTAPSCNPAMGPGRSECCFEITSSSHSLGGGGSDKISQAGIGITAPVGIVLRSKGIQRIGALISATGIPAVRCPRHIDEYGVIRRSSKPFRCLSIH